MTEAQRERLACYRGHDHEGPRAARQWPRFTEGAEPALLPPLIAPVLRSAGERQTGKIRPITGLRFGLPHFLRQTCNRMQRIAKAPWTARMRQLPWKM